MVYNMRDMLYHLKNKDYVKYNSQEKYDESNKYSKEHIYEAVKDNIDFFAHHQKLYHNQDTLFEIPISCFSNLKLKLDDFLEIQDRFISSATGLYGRKYDNSAWVLLSDSYGRLFRAYIHKVGKGYGLNLYDTSGSVLLVSINTKNNELTKEEIKQLESAWDLLMRHYEDQKRSKGRYEEIKRNRDYIKIEHLKSEYASKYYKITISKEIPIDLSNDEIAKYCDNWNYCFGGKCELLTENADSKIYNVVIYTD